MKKLERTSDFQEGGAFRASIINGEFDSIINRINLIEEKIDNILDILLKDIEEHEGLRLEIKSLKFKLLKESLK